MSTVGTDTLAMGEVRTALTQFRYEQRAYWRNPAAAFFTFTFPILFLIVSATASRSRKLTIVGLPYSQFVVIGMLLFGVVAACYVNLGMTISIRRDSGVLKRVRGTPISLGAYLAGVILNALLNCVILAAVILGMGFAFYGLPAPAHAWLLAVTLLVGVVTFCSLGLAVTVIVPNAEAAPAIINGLYLPVMFISGVFYPQGDASILSKIAAYFPVRHLVDASVAAFHGGAIPSGTWNDLIVMGLWAVGGLAVARRRFRWEPRRK